MKIEMPVDVALVWAYRQLAKREDNSLGAPSIQGSSFWELATRVDHSYRALDIEIGGKPHEDAYRLDKHVRALPTIPIRWSRDQGFLLGDLRAYLRVEDLVDRGLLTLPRAWRKGKGGAEVTRDYVTSAMKLTPALVKDHAIMGSPPWWDVG